MYQRKSNSSSEGMLNIQINNNQITCYRIKHPRLTKALFKVASFGLQETQQAWVSEVCWLMNVKIHQCS